MTAEALQPLNAWCNASWPIGDSRNLARGYFRIHGYRPEVFEFVAGSSYIAQAISVKLLLSRWSMPRKQPLIVHVSNESLFKNPEIRDLLRETGSTLKWIKKGKLDQHLGRWLRLPRPGATKIPEGAEREK